MPYTVALVGNPNSGKTTLFNTLTKLRQSVGNWSGVTVEKKEGVYHADKEINLIDLPGVYSLTPSSAEERVTREYLLSHPPDLIINVVDISKPERNLYLTTELLETSIKTVIALNMADELEDGVFLDVKNLSSRIGCTAVPISALKNLNIDLLMQSVKKVLKNGKAAPFPRYSEQVERGITLLQEKYAISRFQAVKLQENDPLSINEFTAKKGAYPFIASAKPARLDNVIVEKSSISVAADVAIGIDIMATERYRVIENWLLGTVTKKKRSLTEKIDRVVLHKYLAFPIFFAVVFLMYYLAIQKAGILGYKYVERGISNLSELVRENLSRGLSSSFVSFICDGIIKGVGAVLAFLPQVAALYFILAVLEGSGYMARAAVITDRLFRGIGLSGKAFIPMVIGTGCSVPAIMAARTAGSLSERQRTILVIPFVPCSAKLPLFAMFAATFFPNSAFIAPILYFIGIFIAAITCYILQRFTTKKENPVFILELPKYRIPSLRGVLKELWHKTKGFLIKAGTIIFIASAVIWLLQNFNWRLQEVDAEQSLLSTIGKVLMPLFVPLGFADWRVSVALLGGMAAKENIVSSLAVLFPEGIAAAFCPASAFAFMVFVLLSTPCLAAVAAMKKEMGSDKKWLIAICLQTGVAYIVALIFRLGWAFYEVSAAGFAVTLIVLTVLLIAVILIKKVAGKNQNKNGGKYAHGCRNRKKCQNGKDNTNSRQTAPY